jgi:hypothetical protein
VIGSAAPACRKRDMDCLGQFGSPKNTNGAHFEMIATHPSIPNGGYTSKTPYFVELTQKFRLYFSRLLFLASRAFPSGAPFSTHVTMVSASTWLSRPPSPNKPG